MPSSVPMVIVLNGASSAGKTSIARELKTLLDNNCVVTGFDDILERVKPFGEETVGVVSHLLRNVRILYFNATDGRLKLFRKLHREVVAHFQANQTVIVETALMDKRALLDAAEQFAPLNAFFIGLKPPLSVSIRWEAGRGDRPSGQAQRHYDLIHAHGNYDLIIEPSLMTPAECATKILNTCETLQPHAFHEIRSHG